MIRLVSNQTAFDSAFTSATMAEVIAYCSDKQVIAVDTETTGLNFLDDKIIMLQIGDKDVQFIIDAREINIRELKPILESTTIKKILQNVKFDYKFLLALGIRMENVSDTMLQEQILLCGNQDFSASLATLVHKYCGVWLEKDSQTSFLDIGSAPFTHTQIMYGANDVAYLIEISSAQSLLAEKHHLQRIFLLENSATLAIADMEFNGMGINEARWLDIAKQAQIVANNLSKQTDELALEMPELHPVVKAYAIQTDLFTPVEQLRKVCVNWDSPKQALNVFRLLIPELTTVNADELVSFRAEYPVIDSYVQYKEATKRVSSYGKKFLENRYSDGRIHTNFKQILVTGRMSSSGPNMQQIPQLNEYRNCFEPGIEDYVFVSGDYSSQELALIAHQSNDPVWLNALRAGQDLHSICAEQVYGDLWKTSAESTCAYYVNDAKLKCKCKAHGVLRNNVKTINFGLAYGMTYMKLAERLQITEEDANKLIRKYFKIFPRIKASLEESATFAKFNGYIRTMPPWGRIRWFPEWRGKDTEHSAYGSIEREGKNTKIQGAGADMTKYAMHLLRKHINEHNLPVKLVLQVHDQIDTICHKNYAPEWKLVMKELMEKSAQLTIPSGLLKAEVNITTLWEK